MDRTYPVLPTHRGRRRRAPRHQAHQDRHHHRHQHGHHAHRRPHRARDHGRLHRRSARRARGPAHALRFRLGPGACAGRPTRHNDRRPAHDLRRRGAGAARRGGLARDRGAAPRARRRGGGGELPPQLHQRCARAPRAGDFGRRDAGQLRLPLLRHPARDPRVRAHQHDRRQRLSRPGAGALSRRASRAPGRHRLRRVGPDHPFRRRRDVHRGGAAHPGADLPVGAGGGRDGGGRRRA